jgi:hypothetical protein
MHRNPMRRRIPRVIPVLWVVALVGICWGSTTAIAAVSHSATKHPKSMALAGTWSGHYGGAYSGTFRLHWRQSGSRLTGSITLSNPGGKYGITGSVHGKAITFGAVGVGATYTGKVSGKSMSGSYKTPGGGGKWSARKTS